MITVTGQYNVLRTDPADNGPTLCGASSSVAVTPIVALPKPQITRLAINDASAVELSFDVQPQTRYRLEQRGADGAYSTVAMPENLAPGPFTQSLGNLNATGQVYTFRVTAFDACGNSLSSEEISTVVLGAAAADSRNEVTWRVNAGTNPGGFALFVNNAALTAVGAGQTGYIDNNVRCPEQYCYRAEAAYPNGSVSVSNTVCVNAVSTRPPAALGDVTVTIRDAAPVLAWTAPNGGSNEYFITRSTDGGAFQSIARVAEAGFTDENARPGNFSYCYRISYTDACNNRSAETAEICPVWLNVQTEESGDGLTWSPYREWAAGVAGYVIEKRDAAGQLLSSENVGNGTSTDAELDTAHQVVRYRIRVTGNGLESFSNEVEVRRPLAVFLPDAFTPNGDGVNDVYAAKGMFISSLQLVIYDRWGSIVFSTDSRDTGWDGTVNGTPAAPGTYVCLVNAIDQTGRKTTRRSGVLLIR
jgi:gliding motility-associated-like protein